MPGDADGVQPACEPCWPPCEPSWSPCEPSRPSSEPSQPLVRTSLLPQRQSPGGEGNTGVRGWVIHPGL